MVTVSGIGMYRDGGTILFRADGEPCVNGRYRLRTPAHGEPRPLFRDEIQLGFGDPSEHLLLRALQLWLQSVMTEEIANALAELDAKDEWRNLAPRLHAVVPIHRIRSVALCLQDRCKAERDTPA